MSDNLMEGKEIVRMDLITNIKAFGILGGIGETCVDIKDEIVMIYDDVRLQSDIKKEEKKVIKRLMENDSSESIKRQKEKYIEKNKKNKEREESLIEQEKKKYKGRGYIYKEMYDFCL